MTVMKSINVKSKSYSNTLWQPLRYKIYGRNRKASVAHHVLDFSYSVDKMLLKLFKLVLDGRLLNAY